MIKQKNKDTRFGLIVSQYNGPHTRANSILVMSTLLHTSIFDCQLLNGMLSAGICLSERFPIKRKKSRVTHDLWSAQEPK